MACGGLCWGVSLGWARCVFTVRFVASIYVHVRYTNFLCGRYYLGYHNARQIIWGLSIGSFLGVALYVVSELIPRCWPSSYLGRTKIWLLSNPVSTWLEIRDGWAVWPDAGRESEWVRWRMRWEEERRGREAKRTQ